MPVMNQYEVKAYSNGYEDGRKHRNNINIIIGVILGWLTFGICLTVYHLIGGLW